MWTIGGRLGYLTSPNTLVYGLLGYTEASFSDPTLSISGFTTATVSAKLPALSGWSTGFGIETLLASNLSLKAEYRYTELDKESLGTGIENLADIRVEPSIHTGRLSVNYKFNFDRGHEAAPMK
jgi:outer membrane immunogenic protein